MITDEIITDTQFVEIVRRTKLSRVRVAELLGITLPTVRRWRAGQSLPPYNSSREYIAEILRTHAKA